MQMKKIFTLALVCFFAMYSVSFAAVGGKKFSAPKKPSVSTQQKAKTQNDYKPSKDAKSLEKNAPAANSKTNAQSAASTAKPQGSAMGNMMRNVGLFAGGMMLGSMLGSMFGMGEGFLADMLGMVMNVLLIMGVFMIGRMLWTKFKNRNKKKDEENIYRTRK